MKRNNVTKNAGPSSSGASKPVPKNDPEDKDLPGYPHYPPSEDIMNPGNGFEKTGADVEELANSRRLSLLHLQESASASSANEEEEEDDDLGIVRGTEADVTKDDLLILGAAEEDADLGDDEETGKKARVDQLTEDDLDIPGSELDDKDEAIGEEDEENNYYSLGGDRHESLEEDPS